VLLLGETGSGREVIARAIHERSARHAGPMVRVNCGAIAQELVDSELFGHERGSFTGAVGTRKGWFERAHGGTLLLDEIGELPLAAQVRLLRVLQDGTLQRVGGERPITVDVRIVAATHRDLRAMADAGSFREDLWYRISVFPLVLPPLRERKQDVAPLARHFADGAGLRLHGVPLVPTPEDLELLEAYDWPGNVRELAAVVERAAILGGGSKLDVRRSLGVLPPLASARPVVSASSLESVNRRAIEEALTRARGRIEGDDGAARLLGIHPATLRSRMRRLQIDWRRFRST
jgi:hydrogenase-4 transcriptional activator